jgi:signal peptidase II
MAVSRKSRLFWPLLTILLLTDCATKELAERHLVTWVPHEIVGQYLRFTLAYNPGAALSLDVGPHSRIIFSGAAVVAVALLAAMYRRTDSRAPVTVVALAMVMGGAIGNLFDRLRSTRGVVDFIDVGVGSWRLWTFNVADVGVSIGALLLAWQLSRAADRAPRKAGF